VKAPVTDETSLFVDMSKKLAKKSTGGNRNNYNRNLDAPKIDFLPTGKIPQPSMYVKFVFFVDL